MKPVPGNTEVFRSVSARSWQEFGRNGWPRSIIRSVHRGRPFRTAFTLIEVVTVVGIIAVLLAILVPALTSARNRGKRAHCLARIKEIGVATATYAAGNDDLLPPAVIGWHPTQQRMLAKLDLDPCDLPVNYGWAELLYEEMYPGETVDDFEEFAEGRWSHFPAQRNYKDKYNRAFNCAAASVVSTHAGHYRVYMPGWATRFYATNKEGRIVRANNFSVNVGSSRLSDISPGDVLLGDANESSSQGDYEERRPYMALCPERMEGLNCPAYETSYIGLATVLRTEDITSTANSYRDRCKVANPGNRFSHRHSGGANFLFGDFHAEWSDSLRLRLACDHDLNGIPDGVSDDARLIAGCDPPLDNP
jgi:prepilin-type processing-associated H-X9-DG protein